MTTAALVKRIFLQMLRDRRALALMMIAPLLVLTLLHYLFNGSTIYPKVGIVNVDRAVTDQIKDTAIKQYSQVADPQKTIVQDNLDALLEYDGKRYTLTLKNDDPTTAKPLQMKIQQAIAAEMGKKQSDQLSAFIKSVQTMLPPAAKGQIKLSKPEIPKVGTHYVYGSKDTTYFDKLGPILVGFFVFFFVFLISGIALLRERTTGTLERLMATPIRRSQLVLGYLLGYGIFAFIQTIIVVFFAVKVLSITLAGSLWNVVLINLLLALVALSLGILLSSFANSEFQMMQFIPIVVIPQIFFAGILPFAGMAGWLQAIAKCMPMYYAGSALTDIMYKGLGLSDISFNLFILLGFALVFLILNVFALKKYRKI